MALTTGPIENVGNQPANANRVRVKILNRTAGPLTGVARVFRLDGSLVLIEQVNFNVNSNASTFATLSLVHPTFGQAFEYEVQIVPNQPGGLYSVYGLTAENVIITAQRVVNSELTQFL
ncbi:ATPase [Bacillus cereus]|uniref:ATPase n=1 Tax=Bacillus TaxID=1386 RepID=UPI000BECFF4D|nr:MULTISPECIES: ATPase [Bacillus]KAB7654205.1 ATPase [Bacillus sp. B2-WWTP-C-10-Post-4]MCU4995631.1 ATPase [Bacillus cereus]MDA2266183.1 ATPase [Bacillus cereus]MDC7774553.1 ATPase [Bacillus cereus]PEE94560.1 ATPase [Bacillus cereus]